jgi:hypothetical protein
MAERLGIDDPGTPSTPPMITVRGVDDHVRGPHV